MSRRPPPVQWIVEVPLWVTIDEIISKKFSGTATGDFVKSSLSGFSRFFGRSWPRRAKHALSPADSVHDGDIDCRKAGWAACSIDPVLEVPCVMQRPIQCSHAFHVSNKPMTYHRHIAIHFRTAVHSMPRCSRRSVRDVSHSHGLPVRQTSVDTTAHVSR